MRVCATRDPIPRTVDAQRVECWLHEPISPEESAPLQQVEVSVADEA